jgi:glyoxylase-like metal-dependent hydrolase (beta-lactamase superfamily II)
MVEYLRQLERLRGLAPLRGLYTGHGGPAPVAAEKIAEVLAHRRLREEKVLIALATPGTLEQITARAYDDTPAELHGLAARSCLATLEKLEREGRARQDATCWRGQPGAI